MRTTMIVRTATKAIGIWASALVVCAPLFLACDDPSSAGADVTNATDVTNADTAGTDVVSPGVAGTFGGGPFRLDGALFVHEGTRVSIYLSSFADTCGHINDRSFPAGGGIIQIDDVSDALGVHEVAADTNVFVLSAACPSGAAIDDTQLAWRGGVPSAATLTIKELSGTALLGALELRYPDGSEVSGTFSATSCTWPNADGGVCE